MRRAWERRSFADKQRLGRLAIDPDAPVPAGDRPLVRALAAARVRTRWRLYAGAVVLGWLVFSTVWGFGRAAFDAAVSAFLFGGVTAGLLATAAAVLDARVRVGHARRRLAQLSEPDAGGPSA